MKHNVSTDLLTILTRPVASYFTTCFVLFPLSSHSLTTSLRKGKRTPHRRQFPRAAPRAGRFKGDQIMAHDLYRRLVIRDMAVTNEIEERTTVAR